jgi:CRP-like cAMP-binding protein
MDSKSIFSFLHDHYLFKYLTDDELGQILPLFKPIELEKGEVLYRAGFPGRNFFIIINGQISLVDDQENETIIDVNGHFGDKALYREGIRSETAQALENSLILAINKRGFQAILAAYPSIESRIKAIKTSTTIVNSTVFPWI